jgi:hypothetical protein
MRDAIDPAESEYYQTILWIADEQPCHFDRWQRQPWIGARWQHATQTQLPGIEGCATTLVMVQDLHEANAAQLVSALTRFEAQGSMLCAIVVRSTYGAWLIHRAWSNQTIAPAENIPPIIAVETASDGYACLRLLNQFTYAAMLICADWFDVRVSFANWQRPCRYRHVGAENIDHALTLFAESAAEQRLTLALQLDPEPDLDHFNSLADIAESRAYDKEGPLLLASLFCNTNSSASEIHWLELLPDDADSLNPPPVLKWLQTPDKRPVAESPPRVGIFWRVLEELSFHTMTTDEASNIDWQHYAQQLWSNFSPETPMQELLKAYEFDFFPRGRVEYMEEARTFIVIADKHLQGADARKAIKTAFDLPDSTQFCDDPTYQCRLCRDCDHG